VKRKFPNKKKRTCYNCGITDHFIAKCPNEKKMTSITRARNKTVVTLIRDKKKFEYFTPNDVLGRILTFDMQR